MTAPRPRSPQPKQQLDAGIFQAEISSFALRLAAEAKAGKTVELGQDLRAPQGLVDTRGGGLEQDVAGSAGYQDGRCRAAR